MPPRAESGYTPLWLIRALHDRLVAFAHLRGRTRTEVIATAVEEYLDRQDPPAIREQLAQAVAQVRARYGYEATGQAIPCPHGHADCSVLHADACRGCDR